MLNQLLIFLWFSLFPQVSLAMMWMMNLLNERADTVYDEEKNQELLKPLYNYNIKCMSIGFLVPPKQAIAWRGPVAVSALQQMVHKVQWGLPDLDVLVLDFAPGTGDTQLSIAQTIPLTGAVIITTPQDVALEDVERGLDMFSKVHVPIIGVIENMSYYQCSKCGNIDHIFGHDGGRELSENHQFPLLGQIPLNVAIRKQGDEGKPIVISAPQSEYAKAFIKVAQKVKESLEQIDTTQAPKIVIE